MTSAVSRKPASLSLPRVALAAASAEIHGNSVNRSRVD